MIPGGRPVDDENATGSDDTLPFSSQDLVDLQCDRYEAALRAGETPKIALFVNDAPEATRKRLLRELILVDLEYRALPSGESPRNYYAREHPELAELLDDLVLPSPEADTVSTASSRSVRLRARDFGRFELIELVGAGGMGEVWKARDPNLDRVVAVKIPRRAAHSREEARRFVREGRAAAQLQHPNIVRVFEVSHADETPYIVSEFIEGTTLRAYCREHQLAPTEAAELTATLAGALHHAHEHGVIHRDMKPGNVMLDEETRPQVTDFGLAKWREDADDMTVSGQLLGTPAYMSPEQACGKAASVDRRADVYGLGAVLYELLTGGPPFTGPEYSAVLLAVIKDNPKPPRLLRPSTPRDLETVCLKAMEKEPGRRYATAAEMADDLRRFMRGDSVLARRATPVEKAWRWAWRRPAVAAALALALACVAAVAFGVGEMIRNWNLRDVRTVMLDTEPSRAQVAFVRLNPITLEPMGETFKSAGRSPVRAYLEPGDYLVVAWDNDGRFHEVYRHVPTSDEPMAGALNHLFWRMDEDGRIWLQNVTLWKSEQVTHNEMVRVALGGVDTGEPPMEVMIDRRETPVGSARRWLEDPTVGPGLAPPDAAKVEFEAAAHMVERMGCRLPSYFELRSLEASLASAPPKGDWEWPPRAPIWTMTPAPVSGGSDAGMSLVGGHSGFFLYNAKDLVPTAFGERTSHHALRRVRSVRPRMDAESFPVFSWARQQPARAAAPAVQ